MAYLIIKCNGDELARRELNELLVVGRAVDCQVCIHDILLSRKHCRFEIDENGWTLMDLSSKNGTLIDHQKIQRHRLKDGDTIIAGKTIITFHGGSFIPSPKRFQRPKEPMVVDPVEALAGTVSGFEYVEPSPALAVTGLPKPMPRPKDPESFARDDIYSMLESIVSSSWDSIYEVNAQPLRKERLLPRPMIRAPHTTTTPPAVRPRRPELSFALQATMPAVIERSIIATQRQTMPKSRMVQIARTAKIRFARISRSVTRTGYIRFF